MSNLDFVARAMSRKVGADLADSHPGHGLDLVGRPTVDELLASTAAGRGAGAKWHAGPFSYVEADSSASDHHLTTAGGVKLYVEAGASGSLNLRAFGARGDGIADDTAAIAAFLSAVQGGHGFMPAGTYRISSLISAALSNCVIEGMQGQTRLTGSFGYAILRLLDLDNVHFRGITFETTYANAVEDFGAAVVYSWQNSVTDSSFRFCKFTAPDANTSGLTFYARTSATDESGTIDGLAIEDCDFTDIGRIGCTIMNRNTNAYTAAQRVKFNRNLGRNLGLSGSNGFLVSLDGFGQNFTCNENTVENAFKIGIESTNWRFGEFRGNAFGDFSRSYAPISLSGAMTGLLIKDNRTLGAAKSRSNFIGVSDSVFSNNSFEATGDYAIHMRGSSNNRFTGDSYKSDHIFCALIGAAGSTTAFNTWDHCRFDTTPSASQYATVRFEGSLTTNNTIRRSTIAKGTGGGLCDQTASASLNVVIDPATDAVSNLAQIAIITMSDADYTIGGQSALIAYKVWRFNGVLTAPRTINFPPAAIYPQPFEFWNNTNYPLTLKPGGGGADIVYPGQRVVIVCNTPNFNVYGVSRKDHNGQHLRLSDYSIWVDASGRLRIKSGLPSSDGDGTVVGTQA